MTSFGSRKQTERNYDNPCSINVTTKTRKIESTKSPNGSKNTQKPGKISGLSFVMSKMQSALPLPRFLPIAEEIDCDCGQQRNNACRDIQGIYPRFGITSGKHAGSRPCSTFTRCPAITAVKLLVIFGAEVALFKFFDQPLFFH